MSLEDPFGLNACRPKCFAQLKYRPIFPGAHMTHAFWYVQGSDEKQIIISGGPNNLNGTAYLNVGAIPTYVGDPELRTLGAGVVEESSFL